MKTKAAKKSIHQLRHTPLGIEMEKPAGKLRLAKSNNKDHDDDNDDDDEAESSLPVKISAKIARQAHDQVSELGDEGNYFLKHSSTKNDADDDDSVDSEVRINITAV